LFFCTNWKKADIRGRLFWVNFRQKMAVFSLAFSKIPRETAWQFDRSLPILIYFIHQKDFYANRCAKKKNFMLVFV